MTERSNSTLALPATTSQDVLTEILRDGAQRLLAQAVEAEVAEWIAGRACLTDAVGHRQVVRNGYLPKRSITTGIGSVEVRQPRVLEGIRGMLVRDEQGAPHVYMMTEPASHYYEIMTRHERMPVLIDQRV